MRRRICVAHAVVVDLTSFIAYAEANPGKLTYASFGPGSVAHIGGVMLNKSAGIELIHVAYKGAGPLTSDFEDWTAAAFDMFVRNHGEVWRQLIRDDNMTMAQ